MEQAVEELEVVRSGDKGAERHERQQPEVVRDGDHNSDCGRAGKRAGCERDEDRGRNPRLKRVAIQLVEGVRADSEAEEEGKHGEGKPSGRHVWGETGPDDDVAQVPARVGQVEERHVVAPAAGGERVEGGTGFAAHIRRPQSTIPPPRLRRRYRTSAMPAARQSSSWRSSG